VKVELPATFNTPFWLMVPLAVTLRLPFKLLVPKFKALLLVKETLSALFTVTVANWLLAFVKLISLLAPAASVALPLTVIAPVCEIAPVLLIVKLPTV
jgi:hypothetical protein